MKIVLDGITTEFNRTNFDMLKSLNEGDLLHTFVYHHKVCYLETVKVITYIDISLPIPIINTMEYNYEIKRRNN